MLGSEDNSTPRLLDLLLSKLGEELGLDDKGVGRGVTFAEDLEEAILSNIEQGGLALSCALCRFRQEREEAVHVDDGTVELVHGLMEVAHAYLAEVARMVLVEEDAVMMHASCVSSASRMLPVLAYPSMAGAHMAPLLPVLLEASRHDALPPPERRETL
eukprot:c40091_g1_i1 orf=3-476(-)